ncbi:MAG: hydroxymethylbilane synthase [Oscillospiraceae bacterium]
MEIKIGTRKSKLATAQTEMVAQALKSAFPQVAVTIVPVSTKGDKVLDKPLSKLGGKGVFVSELESRLLSGEIDIAVHSAKDLPVSLADGLEISGVLKRGDLRDVLVCPKGREFTPGQAFTVGTGSLRRIANMNRLYPEAQFKDIRGNVDTRLKKLKDGEYDGIILAAAGLERLGISADDYSFTVFDSESFLPAPCQGIIAIESRKNDFVTPFIAKINHGETFMCFETERKAIALLCGDCSVPVGGFSEINGGKIRLVLSADCEKTVSGEAQLANRIKLAEELISQL